MSHHVSSDSPTGCRDKFPNFIVVKGNIVEFKEADVLVNPIVNSATDLRLSGAVSKAFYKCGKKDLQKEYEEAGAPQRFGIDITVTGPSGSINAKKIFHATIEGYRGNNSIRLLTCMIKVCLTKAESLNMTSIAFPTIGCGHLCYNPDEVAKCFLEAAKDSEIQIYIVSYTNDLYDTFSKIFANVKESGTIVTKDSVTNINGILQQNGDGQEEVNLRTKPKVKRMSSLLPDVSQLVIKPVNSPKSERSSASDPDPVCDVLLEMSIVIPSIADLDPEFLGKIRDLQTNEVQIREDLDQSTVTLTGKRESLDKVKQSVLKLLAEDELKQANLDYIRETKGIQEYLLALWQKRTIRSPHYWKNTTFDKFSTADYQRCQLVNGSPAYDAVTAFVLNTWDASLVGAEKDASGLVHSRLAVKNIWTIENPFLYANYQSKLKTLAVKAAIEPFSTVSEPKIKTKQIAGVNYLNSQLISEVNEVYLLHGTSYVDEIAKNGIDSRFSGDKVLFGRGAYFAESSTKADQYADRMNERASAGEPLYMFVARVLLGEPFIAQEACPYLRKAPCSAIDCKKDSCSEAHLMCDSVIGTREDINTPLLLREFIVYHPEQCYPEFLVEYVRQSGA